MHTHAEKDKFMLRLPDGWREKIKSIANSNRRSMNAEILLQLERIVTSNDAKKGTEAAA